MSRPTTVAAGDTASGGTDVDDPDGVESPTPGRAGAPGGRVLLAVLLAAVNVPIVVATVRALARGWQPLGDDGILLVRARDVGTGHHPLLGSWTSASMVVGEDLNNPGPLYFDALALPVRLLGPWVGLAVGVMLVNMAASSLAVVAARRIHGVEAMVAVAVGVVGLQFAMGSELLFDVWQPNALVLPFFAFLVVVTALAAGDLVMLPWAVGLASLIVQTHMSFAPLVGLLTVVAMATAVRAGPRSDRWARWRRPVAWAGAIAVLAWSQPVVEQVAGPGEGNLGRIMGAAGSGEAETIGWARATRLVAEVGVTGPWFDRDTYAAPVVATTDLGSAMNGVVRGAVALPLLALLAAGLAAATVWAWRTRRPGPAVLLGMAALAYAGAWLALAVSPLNVVGLAAHQLRLLWPVAALASAAALTALLSALGRRAAVAAPLLVAGTVLVGLVGVLDERRYDERALGPVSDAAALPAAQQLLSGLDALDGRGTVLYDPSGLMFAEPYSGLTFAELQDRGIPFVFDDEGFIRQFGEGRRHDGSADLRMWQVHGEAARTVPTGAERIGYAEGPSGPVALFVQPLDGGG